MNPHNLLAWLNFFVADVRDGLGPFLGVFLLQNGFGEFEIGRIGTISSLIALVLGVPCGILVDKTTRKKELIGAFIALIIAFCALNYLFPSFIFTLLAQGLVALSGVFLAPAFAALTLGIVGVRDYPLQTARNEAYKHAGTAFGAALSFCFALYFGIVSVFVITATLGGISLVVLTLIKRESIDDFTARGEICSKATFEATPKPKPTRLIALFTDKRVLFLSVIMFCFHLSNAAMLPLLSQRAQRLGIDSSGAYAAATILIAQSTMIFVAFLCGRLLRKLDLYKAKLRKVQDWHKADSTNPAKSTQDSEFKLYFWLFFACFFALIIRGGVAAHFDSVGAMIVVQILDGIGAGVSGVVLPVVVALILRGSGHINAGLAFALTCGGLGGALSNGVGGYFAQYYGYFSAYLFLGGVALCGLALWCAGAKRLFGAKSF
ncbi:MFS transporter [Helicobacter sp. T3_23-1059]